LKNTNATGPHDIDFDFGDATDNPVTGDWNADGTDTIGVHRPSTTYFYLRNSNSNGPHDISFYYGDYTDLPVTGNWNGNGTDTIGIRRGTMWYLRNSNDIGVADEELFALSPFFRKAERGRIPGEDLYWHTGARRRGGI